MAFNLATYAFRKYSNAVAAVAIHDVKLNSKQEDRFHKWVNYRFHERTIWKSYDGTRTTHASKYRTLDDQAAFTMHHDSGMIVFSNQSVSIMSHRQRLIL